jgi:hypothetical protein
LIFCFVAWWRWGRLAEKSGEGERDKVRRIKVPWVQFTGLGENIILRIRNVK